MKTSRHFSRMKTALFTMVLAMAGLPACDGCNQTGDSGKTRQQQVTPDKSRPAMEQVREKMKERAAAREAQPSRCAARTSDQLRLLRGDTVVWTRPNRELMQLPGVVAPEGGGKARGPWLPLGVLAADGAVPKAIEFVPCTGDPVRIDWAAVTSSPERFRVVANRRGVLRLLDHQPDGGGVSTVSEAPAEGADEGEGEGGGDGDGSGAGDGSGKKRPRRTLGRNFYEVRLVP